MKKIGWWLDSVHGLRGHVRIYAAMRNAFKGCPPGEWTPEMRAQLRRQKEMVGQCLLSVLLVHPVGSGRFYD